MNLFSFTHFYTAPSEQTIQDTITLCTRIGVNPLFLEKNGDICGYVVPMDILSSKNPNAPLSSYQKKAVLVSPNEAQHVDQIAIIVNNYQIIAWTRPTYELPQYRQYPIENHRIHDFGRFSVWLPRIAELAMQIKCSVFLVGGVVRDFIIGSPLKDVDLLVQGDLFLFMDALQQKYGGELHKEQLFEAAHWRTPDGCAFDFTVARSEWYPAPATIPQTQKGTLLDDIQRRDFTINNMLISITPSGLGYIYDASGGRIDLQQKTLAILHKHSFRDDPTRIFRGVRYSARYTLKPSHKTMEALHSCLKNQYLSKLPYEQLGKELHKIFLEDYPEQCWKILRDWGVLAHIFEGRAIQIKSVLHAWRTMKKQVLVQKTERSTILWLSLITQLPKTFSPLTSFMKRGGKLWNQVAPNTFDIKYRLTNAKNNGDIGLALHKSDEASLVILYIDMPDIITWWIQTGSTIECVVDGRWLIQEGCPKGKLIGQAMQKAQHAAWMGYSQSEQQRIAKSIWIK